MKSTQLITSNSRLDLTILYLGACMHVLSRVNVSKKAVNVPPGLADDDDDDDIQIA